MNVDDLLSEFAKNGFSNVRLKGGIERRIWRKYINELIMVDTEHTEKYKYK